MIGMADSILNAEQKVPLEVLLEDVHAIPWPIKDPEHRHLSSNHLSKCSSRFESFSVPREAFDQWEEVSPFSIVISSEHEHGSFAGLQEEEWRKYGNLVIPLQQRPAMPPQILPEDVSVPDFPNSLFAILRGLATGFVRRMFQNVDLADFERVKALAAMGTGAAIGDNAVPDVLARTLNGPLLKPEDLAQSRWVLANMELGDEMDEAYETVDSLLKSFLHPDCAVLICTSVNRTMGELRILTLCERAL